jgi:hypothetical protein
LNLLQIEREALETVPEAKHLLQAGVEKTRPDFYTEGFLNDPSKINKSHQRLSRSVDGFSFL